MPNHPPAPLRAWTLACTLAGILACALAAPASAATADTTAPAAPTPGPKVRKKHATKLIFDPGSGETRAERERRLTRECRGRPNAGACLGYAS